MPNDNNDAADSTSSTTETHSYTPEELLATIVEDRGDIAQIHADCVGRSVTLTIQTAIVTNDHTVVTTVDRNDLVIPGLSDDVWQIHAVETCFGPHPVDGPGPGVVVFDRDIEEGVTVEEGGKRLRDLLADTI